MTQIIRAEHMGFCFGVRDALQAAERASQPDQTTVYGELVHNQSVTDALEGRNFELMSETQRDVVPERPVVMVTAHGISQKRRQKLLDSGKELIDTTCPLVNRVHDAAMGLAERGFFVVVIGKAQHVEVLGVVEDLPANQWAVVSDPGEVKHYAKQRIGIVSQTTMQEDVAEHCRRRVAELNPRSSLRWVNTICRPTRQRQAAVDQLCQQVDVVIVVGGKNSNNTRRLMQRCLDQDTPAYHVQTADDIQPRWLHQRPRVGLTAGTSTPDATIDAVESHLESLVRAAPADSGSYSRARRRTLKQWQDYFRANLRADPEIPWSNTATLTTAERRAIAQSVQVFQLGESGEGRHIISCAERWIHKGGDAEYLPALKLFLQEENQHASWLGTFLAQEGVPLLERQWSDGCFRFLRHLAGLRTSISVLVTAEILAQVYYLALGRATDSATLQALCRRVLRDECAHVTFQQQQSRRLSERWSRPFRAVVGVFETLLFRVARRIVWHGHRRVFRAANMNWREFRDRSTRRWQAARRVSAA